MGIERKCPSCQTWNNDEDYCINCARIISPILIEEEREKQRKIERFTEPSKFDAFIMKWKNSKFFVFKVLYKIAYGIAAIFFGIAALLAYLAAALNG